MAAARSAMASPRRSNREPQRRDRATRRDPDAMVPGQAAAAAAHRASARVSGVGSNSSEFIPSPSFLLLSNLFLFFCSSRGEVRGRVGWGSTNTMDEFIPSWSDTGGHRAGPPLRLRRGDELQVMGWGSTMEETPWRFAEFAGHTSSCSGFEPNYDPDGVLSDSDSLEDSSTYSDDVCSF